MDLPAVGAKLGRISTCVTATVHAHAVYDREKEVADTSVAVRLRGGKQLPAMQFGIFKAQLLKVITAKSKDFEI